MKSPILLLALLPLSLFAQPNALTEEEKATGFELWFDGKALDGWKHSGNWKVDDNGSIAREGKGGSLVYAAKKIPDDFELRFEWKVGPGSNSGIYYRPSQYEYQLPREVKSSRVRIERSKPSKCEAVGAAPCS